MSKNPKTADIIHNVTLYPDHVVFLGDGLPKLSIKELVENFTPPNSWKLILVNNTGAILNTQSSEAVRAMGKCLSDVLLRLPEEWTVEGLSKNNINELINWDAEKYRQNIATKN